MAGPSVEVISRALPGAEVVAAARPAFLPLAGLLPGVTRALRLPEKGVLAEARALRAEGFDAAVLFPRSLRVALVARLARVPVRVGYGAFGRRSLLTHAVEGWAPWRSRHRTAWFGLLASTFGVEPSGPPALLAPPEALAAADRLLASLGAKAGRPLVLLEPAASYGPAKCGPAERYGDLAARWIEEGADVAVVGVSAGRPVEARIAQRAPGILRAAGKTDDLLALVGLLARANLLVSNDTGPMHLAAALGTPVVALFGASDPVVSAPAGAGPRAVLHDPEPCSPCFLRECPVPGHPCLAKISVDRVLAAGSAIRRGAAAG
jgi:heptosyltransferase-2